MGGTLAVAPVVVILAGRVVAGMGVAMAAGAAVGVVLVDGTEAPAGAVAGVAITVVVGGGDTPILMVVMVVGTHIGAIPTGALTGRVGAGGGPCHMLMAARLM
ncbi:hypothetical protein [Acetobacter fabarum]|nr:hypothetical protein [Acetobacter fabarum]MCP1234011.1 hypothetical protein [Acetobacter fabarum]